MDIRRVIIIPTVQERLLQMPKHIAVKLNSWVELVGENGLNYARRIPGYHDEPLQGKRKGQRSIRLSRGYRAIYVICKDGKIEFLEVREVSKHEYK